MSKKLSKTDIVKKFLKETPKEFDYFVQHAMDLSIQISNLLKKNNLTQRDLAAKLEKSESEISKWLSGNHNLTLRSIAKLEAIFDEQIIYTREDFFEQLSNNIDIKLSSILSSMDDFISTYSSENTISFKSGSFNKYEISVKKNVSCSNLNLIINNAA